MKRIDDSDSDNIVMTAKLISILLVLVSLCSHTNAQTDHPIVQKEKFMGRTITITDPGTDSTGFLPNGPAKLCLEAPPQRQCYTAPEDFGRFPEAKVIQLTKDRSALFFSVASGGVSGFRIHYSLLYPGREGDLNDFFGGWESHDGCEYAFWTDPTLSSSPLFITANYVWGPNEGHHGEHRYTISAYSLQQDEILDDPLYALEDSYMTVRKYEEDSNEILNYEKQEILARLHRVKAEREAHKAR